MNDKEQILSMLSDEFNRWEDLLAHLSEEQITAPSLPASQSIKDVIAHLMAWQQISITRLEAARLGAEPTFPGWFPGADPESDEDLDQANARIYAAYHQQPWQQVHQVWKDGFLRFLELGEAVHENDLMDTKKYAWLDGYCLFDVLKGADDRSL